MGQGQETIVSRDLGTGSDRVGHVVGADIASRTYETYRTSRWWDRYVLLVTAEGHQRQRRLGHCNDVQWGPTTVTISKTWYGPSRVKFNGRLVGEVARSWVKARPPDTTSATHGANTDRQQGEEPQEPPQPPIGELSPVFKGITDYVGAGHSLDTVTGLSTGDEPMADETSLADLYQPIDWHELWNTTTAGPDWLVPDVIERGRVHVIYAPKKHG